ncbi:MAG: type III pantothenate kinase [Lachnospiraceae bacterium]|nr:type III pantothenate kinase [Lachnospiraceae bacterium]
MILTIDTGNTHTVLGFVDDEMKVVKSFRLPTDVKETDSGYAVKISQLMEITGITADDIEGMIISSVAPSVTGTLAKALKMITGYDPMIVGKLDTGLDITAIPGGMIAPDLEVGAIAVKELYPLPSIVIDMGTATTVTVVDGKGAYIGGAIMPGVKTALKGMVEGTSLLPDIDIEAPDKCIAVDTIPSMQSGLVYGSAGAIDGIIDRFVEEMGEEPASIVCTGGLGRLIGRICRHDMIFDDDLLLKGLYIVWSACKSK